MAVVTKTDIVFTISSLSQFNENPGVLRYFKGIADLSIVYEKDNQKLVGYYADRGKYTIDRTSTRNTHSRSLKRNRLEA